MLNLVLDPVSRKHCQFKLNEYCKDSKSYLEDLKAWKLLNKNTSCIVKTVGVGSLYPSLEVGLIKNALEEALTLFTSYNTCMNNFIQFRENILKCDAH